MIPLNLGSNLVCQLVKILISNSENTNKQWNLDNNEKPKTNEIGSYQSKFTSRDQVCSKQEN